ncbi:hypothetical protein ACFQ9Q_31070 [Streptomyces virginiae]|uniref:hypothetical protein n=1 Tax=Streptomyces virginiae TaxID=1961 RepID=UPI00369D8708
MLLHQHALLCAPAGLHGLRVARDLTHEPEPLDRLESLLRSVLEHGLEETVRREGIPERHAELVGQWLSTPDWESSFAWLIDHPGFLDDPLTAELLLRLADDPVAVQHVAVVALAASHSPGEVQDIVTDLETATARGMQAVENGEARTLAAVLGAVPSLADAACTGPYLTAVLHLLDGTPSASNRIDDLLGDAGAQANPTERKAGAVRLRRLPTISPTGRQSCWPRLSGCLDRDNMADALGWGPARAGPGPRPPGSGAHHARGPQDRPGQPNNILRPTGSQPNVTSPPARR